MVGLYVRSVAETLNPERAKKSEVALAKEPAGMANFTLSIFCHLKFWLKKHLDCSLVGCCFLETLPFFVRGRGRLDSFSVLNGCCRGCIYFG